jgi:integral membrane sensor domain MASE1
MEKAFGKIEEMVETLKEYVDTRIEIVKLKTAAKGSAIIANLVAAIIASVFILIFIIIVSIGLAVWLGAWLGNPWLGFLIVGVLHLLIAIIMWKIREKLIRIPVMNSIIKQLFHLKKDDEKN